MRAKKPYLNPYHLTPNDCLTLYRFLKRVINVLIYEVHPYLRINFNYF